MTRGEPGRSLRCGYASRTIVHLVAAGLTVVVLAAVAAAPGATQGTARPTINVSATLNIEAAAPTPLAIRVGPSGTVPRNSFLRIRGLPALAALSEGHSIAPGSWAVPLVALADLKITLPPDAVGKADLTLMLVGIDGTVLAETKSTLVIAAPRGNAQADGKAPAGASILRAGTDLQGDQRSGIGGSSLLSTKAMTPEDRERATRLLQKGQEHLAEANISSARLYFEKAADAGLPQAAMALAATYDGTELGRIGVRGIQADDKQARHWYERALQLGARDAEQRLRRLGAN